MKTTRPKTRRSTIDLSDEVVARSWEKRLRKSKKEIAAVIEKVGPNADTVMRELKVQNQKART